MCVFVCVQGKAPCEMMECCCAVRGARVVERLRVHAVTLQRPTMGVLLWPCCGPCAAVHACRCAGKQGLSQAENGLFCVQAAHEHCYLLLCTMQGLWDQQVDALGGWLWLQASFCSPCQRLLKVFHCMLGAWPVWWRPPAASVLFRVPLVMTSKGCGG